MSKPITRAMKAAAAAKKISNLEVKLKDFQINFYMGEIITHVTLSPQNKDQWYLIGVRYQGEDQVTTLSEPVLVQGSSSFGSRDQVESNGYFHPNYMPSGITTLPRCHTDNLREWLSEHFSEGLPEPVGSTAWRMRTEAAYARAEQALPSFRKELYALSKDLHAYRQRDWLEKNFPGFKAGEEKAIEAVIKAVLNPIEGEVVHPHLPVMRFLWAAVNSCETKIYYEKIEALRGRPDGTDGMR